jgi:hypothetical protein
VKQPVAAAAGGDQLCREGEVALRS